MTTHIRPDWDHYFMDIARTVGERATCDRGRSGCVITRDKQILVTGYVGAPKGLPHCDDVGHQIKKVTHEDGSVSEHCLRTTHAEQNALAQAAKFGVAVDGGTLYCSMTPCPTCAKMIINAGIVRVVCDKRYHQGGEGEVMFELADVKLSFLDGSMMEYGK